LNSEWLNPIKTGLTLTGNDIGDSFGYSVATAGDVNNDGYDDIIVGANLKYSSTGEVYVIYGGPTSSFENLDLTKISLVAGSTGFKITGNAVGDQFGYSVSGAGDINNDGYDDIIIGAGVKNMAYVIYGKKKSLLQDIDLSLTILDPGTTGFTISGAVGNFGYSVSKAGNVNKDEYDENIIGARSVNSGRGAAYVIYGRATASFGNIDVSALISTSTGFTIKGKSGGDNLGISVSTAGDINNDKYDDIIIGASGRTDPLTAQGEVYVIYGGEKSSMVDYDLSLGTPTLNPGTTGFTLTGKYLDGSFGRSVNTAGDINNDGYDDIIIGAYKENNQAGGVYVVYGGEKSSMSDLDFRTGIVLDPATKGFLVTAEAAGDHLGFRAASAGDLNNDGYDDTIFGADTHGRTRGRVYVIYGKQTSLLENIDLSQITLDPLKTGFTISGEAIRDSLGYSVGGARDINGDGYDDLIVAASNKNSKQGVIYIIHAVCPVAHCIWFLSRSCQACEQGYIVSDSVCVPFSAGVNSKTSLLGIASAIVSGVGSVISIGNAAFPVMSLVSEIVQNTRYMNLTVTTELSDIYKTWNTDLISWDVPDLVSRYDYFREAPSLFAQYDLGSSFLSNFWSNIMTLGVALSLFIAFVGLKWLVFQGTKPSNGSWFYSLLQKMSNGSLNSTLVQAYGCIDDIFFYLVLDLKTNPFEEFFSWASLFIAIAFVGLSLWLILFNVLIVKRYQVAKSDEKSLKAFSEKNKHWELFYSDFDDADGWSHSFLALLIIRSTLSSLLITIFYKYPFMQGIFLLVLDGSIITFMLLKKPLITLRAIFFQYYFEFITIIVHICTIVLSSQGEEISDVSKKNLSTCIIYMNTALVTGGIAFMFIEIHETVNEKVDEWKQRKSDSKEKNTGLEENSEILSFNSIAKIRQPPRNESYNQILPHNRVPPNVKQRSRNDSTMLNIKHKQRPNQEVGPLQNFSYKRNDRSVPVLNASQGANSSMIAEEPFVNESDLWMDQQRDRSRRPMIERSKLRAIPRIQIK